MIVAVAFLFGLLFGSFLNVCIHRLPRDLSVVRPRSFCPKCERTITWYDNIPVLSYLLLRGRCRYCGNPIALRYPLIELVTGICFAVCLAALGPTPKAVKWCVFSAISIALAATDFEHRLLPNELTLGGAALGLILAIFVPMEPDFIAELLPATLRSIGSSVFGAAICSGSIWFVAWAYKKIRHREGMGFGDVKMLAMIGAFLGAMNGLLSVAVGSLLGAITGIVFITLTRKDASTYELPFGSFLGISALAVAMFVEVLGYCVR
jgi:leader peptidase (prepilin peptidase)/N-methyltransferase